MNIMVITITWKSFFSVMRVLLEARNCIMLLQAD